MQTVPTEVADRFWAKVNKTDTCWLWTAALDPQGYGRFNASGFEGRRTWFAHRFSYRVTLGPIPGDLELDHLCRVRNCINPAHLEPVTTRVNCLRSESIGAINSRKTHCPEGHPYNDKNTKLTKRNQRKCRSCLAASERRRQRRIREAALTGASRGD